MVEAILYMLLVTQRLPQLVTGGAQGTLFVPRLGSTNPRLEQRTDKRVVSQKKNSNM